MSSVKAGRSALCVSGAHKCGQWRSRHLKPHVTLSKPSPQTDLKALFLPMKALRTRHGVRALSASGRITPRARPAPPAEAHDDDGRRFAIATAAALNMVKASDVSVLDVSGCASWTSFMVFAGVNSKPQLLAALDRVEKLAAEQFGREPQNSAGSSPWECLDFGDCLVHVMSVEQREFYDVESFYATAEKVKLPFDERKTVPESAEPTSTWTLEPTPA